jgi:O-antigen/teichoic acid export membrane protein
MSALDDRASRLPDPPLSSGTAVPQAPSAGAFAHSGPLAWLESSLRYLLGKPTTTDHRKRRLAGIVQGVATGLAARAIGVVVSLVSVPLAIHYLGPERFGVSALIGSLLAWARLADFGIGNSLTNELTGALGAGRLDLARVHVSTALAMFAAIAAALGLVVAAAWPWIHWNALLGVHSALGRAQAGPAVAVAIGFFLAGFPLSVIGRVYAASQDGRLSNYWGIAGRIAGLLALFLVTRTSGGLVAVVLAGAGVGIAMTGMSGLWLFTRHKSDLSPHPALIRRESAGKLVSAGWQFFLIQIMALIVFETDNLIIAHYLAASAVPPYSLTYNLFGYAGIIQGLLFNYVWVGYTDAIARRDIEWVRRTFRMNIVFSMGFTLLAIVPLIFIARPFIRVWAGAAVVPPFDLVLWMAAWSMINALCSPIACLLASASRMKAQLVYSAASSASNIGLSIYLVRHWGISGVIAATVLAYLVFIVVPASIDASLLLRKLRHAV